ncbi:MAG: hypothetical protein C0597_00020 [Marinilabiliales bacterium]|nr:MAG: hypothetical protein C0597_00020 [Marinilabiliales bacterium]
MKDGRPYMDYNDFAFYGSSGSLRQEYGFNAMDYVYYPFDGTVQVEAPNYYRTGVDDYQVRFRIEQKGSYKVKVYL